MSKLDNHFSIPIYEHVPLLSEINNIQTEISSVWDTISLEKFENPVDWKDGVQTNIYNTDNTIEKFNLVSLKKYIEAHLYNYTDVVRSEYLPDLYMQHSWVNITNKDQGQDSHQHRDAIISGVYYYQTTENDGDIIFENPNPFIDLELFPIGLMAKKAVRYKPKVGKIILFPGWLKHRVEPNPSNDPRISFSFNFTK